MEWSCEKGFSDVHLVIAQISLCICTILLWSSLYTSNSTVPSRPQSKANHYYIAWILKLILVAQFSLIHKVPLGETDIMLTISHHLLLIIPSRKWQFYHRKTWNQNFCSDSKYKQSFSAAIGENGHVGLAKIQIALSDQSTMSAWRKYASLPIQNASSDDNDQTVLMGAHFRRYVFWLWLKYFSCILVSQQYQLVPK